MSRGLVTLALVAAAFATASAAAARTPLPGFASPSGNIRCLYVPPDRDATGHVLPARLLCSIARAGYAAALQRRCPRPDGSGVDWHGWTLGADGKALVSWSGGILYNPDRFRPAYATLAYGRSWLRGGFTCESRRTGVTCRNPAGHGLFVSRQVWRAW